MSAYLKIGHRGACGYKPENTSASFKKALEFGVDMIELDVQLCETGELVVIHDNSVDRTTNGNGKVADKTLYELKLLDAGKGEKILTLREVFDLINRKTKINIELKAKDISQKVLDLIKEYVADKKWSRDDFMVSSFDHEELAKFAGLNSGIKISILIKDDPFTYVNLSLQLNVYSISAPLKLVTRKLVEDIHQNNLKIFVWTVNEKKDIEKMKSLGVDGIFSDYPDRL